MEFDWVVWGMGECEINATIVSSATEHVGWRASGCVYSDADEEKKLLQTNAKVRSKHEIFQDGTMRFDKVLEGPRSP